jgi:hypothetical protein
MEWCVVPRGAALLDLTLTEDNAGRPSSGLRTKQNWL